MANMELRYVIEFCLQLKKIKKNSREQKDRLAGVELIKMSINKSQLNMHPLRHCSLSVEREIKT